MDELKIYVDKQGTADRLEKQINDESHQLIEEFMLIANEQIARLFKRERMAGIYRVHDKPEEDKLNELKQTMLSYGLPCGNLNKPSEMSRLLSRLKEHPQAYSLKLHVLKSLKTSPISINTRWALRISKTRLYPLHLSYSPLFRPYCTSYFRSLPVQKSV